jgi:hypothetical protein
MSSNRSTIHLCNISREYLHRAGKSMLSKTSYQITSLIKGTVQLPGRLKSVLAVGTGYL